jgi:hypothetical protein
LGALRLGLAIAFGVSGTASQAVHTPEHIEPDLSGRDIQPRMIADQFMSAVARGSLDVFGTRVTTDQLVPRRVHRVYDLQTHASTQEVYAELEPPFPVPGQDDCEVRGISVQLDAFGGILESSAHVWCE